MMRVDDRQGTNGARYADTPEREVSVVKKVKIFGAILLALGILLNTFVVIANGRTMPVVGMPATFHAASPMWRAANPSDHLLPLADHASLGFFSLGDFCLMAGALVLAFRFVTSRKLCFENWQDIVEYVAMLAVILVIVISTSGLVMILLGLGVVCLGVIARGIFAIREAIKGDKHG